jgi:phosphohistidine phosphatase
MRELTLLRHAEATPHGKDGEHDADRPLTDHGRLEATAAGDWLRSHGGGFDRILCSPSLRTRQTLELALGQPEAAFEDSIYDATVGTLYDLLDQNASHQRVLLVGHNPGIEQLVAFLVEGRSDEFRGMPPSAIARLRFDDSLAPGTAVLEHFWSPGS